MSAWSGIPHDAVAVDIRLPSRSPSVTCERLVDGIVVSTARRRVDSARQRHLASFDRKSARGRSMVQRHRPPLPEGGRSTNSGAAIRGPERPGAVQSSYYNWVNQFDTRGSAATCRSPPAHVGFAEALLTASSSPCASPIRWASSQGLDGRIDEPMAAGRAGNLVDLCWPRPHHIGGGKGRPARSCISSCARIPLAR